MEFLVIMFIIFVISKLFGGIAKQLPQNQRRTVGRPFPNIPSEWNFPRPTEIYGGNTEPVPSEEPSSTKDVIFLSQKKELRKVDDQSGSETVSKSLTVELNPQIAENNNSVSQFGESPLENLLAAENLISGVILAELLQPPKSKRGAR